MDRGALYWQSAEWLAGDALELQLEASTCSLNTMQASSTYQIRRTRMEFAFTRSHQLVITRQKTARSQGATEEWKNRYKDVTFSDGTYLVDVYAGRFKIAWRAGRYRQIYMRHSVAVCASAVSAIACTTNLASFLQRAEFGQLSTMYRLLVVYPQRGRYPDGAFHVRAGTLGFSVAVYVSLAVVASIVPALFSCFPIVRDSWDGRIQQAICTTIIRFPAQSKRSDTCLLDYII